MTIRVGVLGLTHDHIWSNLENLAKVEGAEIVAAAEPHAPLRERFAQRYGRPTYDRYDALLETERDLQALFLFGDNRWSAHWGAIAAARGLHVMLEKPMAADLAGADELFRAAARARTHLMINWPHNWNPKLRHAYALARNGAVGDVFKLRYSGGHAGPREIGCSPIFCDWLYDAHLNGAGALVDQGGYGATVCRWFLGRPTRVMAMGGRLTKDADSDVDNVVMLLRYDRAIAVSETSWSWVGGQPSAGPVVYGTEGTLYTLGARDAAGVGIVRKGDREPAMLDAPAIPLGDRNAPEYFISRIRADRPIEGMVSAHVSRDAQEILECARVSIATGREVAFPYDAALPGIGA
ncbi:MAG: Gfo/Idh/MocA family oxidoreductase [Chloroflexi bacterium]|nr:Gfo/Idh/MocA family oxidoreductase [Chloroflexota bacterium]